MLRKYIRLISIAVLLFLTQCGREPEVSPLALTIRSDKVSYQPGDSILISYTIKNTGSDPIGFYIQDQGNVELEAFDVSGNPLEYYFHASWQRMMPSLYPDEYVLLTQNQEWERSVAFPLRKGVIEDYPEAKSKVNPGNPTIIHDGFYIDLPLSPKNDHILIPSNHREEIQLRLIFFTNDPNPNRFSVEDCEEAKLTIDAFPQELTSNRISQSVICEEGACPEPVGEIKFEDVKPIHETFNLAMYCQHNTALSKQAWMGTIQSQIISIGITD